MSVIEHDSPEMPAEWWDEGTEPQQEDDTRKRRKRRTFEDDDWCGYCLGDGCPECDYDPDGDDDNEA